MSLNTVTFNEFVAQGEISWNIAHEMLPLVAENSGLWRKDTFPMHSGDTRVYNEIDSELYAANKGEGDQITEGLTQIGYKKIMYLKRIGLSKTVTWEMIRRNKYQELTTLWTTLGTTVANRRELDLQHRLGFGTATSYTDKNGTTVDLTVGDGFQLFYTAHTLTGSSTTYRNRLAGNAAFSKGSLEGMEQMAIENSFNNHGEKVNFGFDIIWSTEHSNTVNSIAEQLQATAEISAPNEGVPNVYRSRYRHKIFPMVATDANGGIDSTKNKYWGLSSSKNTQLFLAIEDRLTVQSPSVGGTTNANDILTDDMIFKATGSYGIVSTSGRGNMFSSGDGTA